MAVSTRTAINGYLRFANGTKSDGSTKYLNVSMGALSASGWDVTKAYTVSQALKNLYEKTYAGLYTTETAAITNE